MAAERALAVVHRHLTRCKPAASTVNAYRRQTSAYVTWLASHTAGHPDAFADTLGVEAAVTAWRRHLITGIGMLDGVSPGRRARYRH